MKLPPFGKPLAERLKFGNPPLYCVVCVGMGAWSRAKKWHASPDKIPALVLPHDTAPNVYEWPVQDVGVVIDADVGPSIELIHALASHLLACGSDTVTLVSFTDSHPFTRFVRRESNA